MEPQEPRGKLGWIAGGVALAVVVVALALAILLDQGPFSEPELSRGELIARGDEICRKAHEAFAELQKKPPQTAGQATDLTGKLVDIASDELDEIGSLKGPPEFDAEIERYLTARERGIEALRRGRDAAEAGDNDAYVVAQAELADSQLERQRIARRIGFAQCSRPLVGRGELEQQAQAPATADPEAPPTVNNPPTGG
ncbi:MAG: hypothetical protein ACHQJ5_01845 [Vicinamibacteria bacterium]